MPLPSDALVEHRHRIYGYALRLLRNEHEAADVTQDVLVRLWRHGESVGPDRRVAWALRVTRNACLDVLRARDSRTRHVTSEAVEYAEAASNGHAPDVLTEAADFRRSLERALSDLDEPYRSIIVLREIEGLSYRDVAETLDLPLNTLKVYLHRARRRLREALLAALPAEDLQP